MENPVRKLDDFVAKISAIFFVEFCQYATRFEDTTQIVYRYRAVEAMHNFLTALDIDATSINGFVPAASATNYPYTIRMDIAQAWAIGDNDKILIACARWLRAVGA